MDTAVFSRSYIADVVITVVRRHEAEGHGAQSLQVINAANNGDTAEEDEVIVNCHLCVYCCCDAEIQSNSFNTGAEGTTEAVRANGVSVLSGYTWML